MTKKKNNKMTKKKNNEIYVMPEHVKLELACSNGDLELVKSLIEKQEYEDINDLNETLSSACESSDNIDVILFLLEKGIHPNYGIREVCRNGNLELLKLLIEKGANNFHNDIECAFECRHKYIRDNNFNHDCYCEHMEIIKLLVEKGTSLYYYIEPRYKIIRDQNIKMYKNYIFWQHVILRNIEKRQVFIIKKLSDDILYKITEYL